MLCVLIALTPATGTIAADAGCRPTRGIRVQAQFDDGAVRSAVLGSLGTTGLMLGDPSTGEPLWSASASPTSLQVFPDMTAAFGESLAVVDLNQDGVHDRLYAGDRAGRLWRFALHSGAEPGQWAQGGVWADLSAPGGGRGFIAPPDIALHLPADQPPWISVAIGSASIGTGPVENRLYVLRDVRDGSPAGPFTELDLIEVTPLLAAGLPLPAPAGATARGYFVSLGGRQVFASSLTLQGQVHFIIADTLEALAARCTGDEVPTASVNASIAVVRAADGAPGGTNGDPAAGTQDQGRTLPRAIPADSRIGLAALEGGGAGCEADGLALPDCGLDGSIRLRNWRREDAD